MGIQVSPDLPVLIAGAGPAGLSLAQGLRKRGMPFRVFEREADINARTQGWAVALQWTVEPLKKHVPDDLPDIETTSHLHNVGLSTNINAFDRDGNLKSDQARSGNGSFLRADRQKLRNWLRTNVNVEWNKRITKYEETKDSVKAYFEDGTTAEGCALVGGDGANSAVRSQLVNDNKLRDGPFEGLMGYLVLPKEEYEEVFSQMARSVNVIQSDDVFMFQGLHNMPDDAKTANFYWMLFHPCSEETRHKDIDQWSKSKMQEVSLAWAKPLPEKFQRFIKQTKLDDFSETVTFLKVWSPPESGVSSGRVTLIGDGLHKITPLGGVGVNHAIQDTLDLCKLLDEKDSVESAIKAYDAEVIKRAREAVEKCQQWPVLQFGE